LETRLVILSKWTDSRFPLRLITYMVDEPAANGATTTEEEEGVFVRFDSAAPPPVQHSAFRDASKMNNAAYGAPARCWRETWANQMRV
jgi:hypothetical protein